MMAKENSRNTYTAVSSAFFRLMTPQYDTQFWCHFGPQLYVRNQYLNVKKWLTVTLYYETKLVARYLFVDPKPPQSLVTFTFGSHNIPIGLIWFIIALVLVI